MTSSRNKLVNITAVFIRMPSQYDFPKRMFAGTVVACGMWDDVILIWESKS
jgi:hypothetical protein